MFIRFVTTRIHKDSRKQEGVFTAAYNLQDSGELSPEERKRLREILIWFNRHLPHPPRKFSAERAIFWFKSTSNESISQIWELVSFLRVHDYQVEAHKCRNLRTSVTRTNCRWLPIRRSETAASQCSDVQSPNEPTASSSVFFGSGLAAAGAIAPSGTTSVCGFSPRTCSR